MNVIDSFRLGGRTAIVTGAGRGLGFEIAQALAEAGSRVAIFELNADLCETAVDRLSRAGFTAIGIPTDVTDQDAVQRAVARVQTQFGTPDILVNNAGVGYRKQDDWPTASTIPLEHVSMQNWRFVQDTNLNSVFYCTQAAGRLMLEKGKGAIVNVASISGIIGNIRRDNTAYAAAKAGVIMMTRQLAAAWAPRGIRINAIAPGYMSTEMGALALQDPKCKDLVPTMTPMGRPGEPSEVKGLAVFLASDASSYITGQCVVVDGGYTLW